MRYFYARTTTYNILISSFALLLMIGCQNKQKYDNSYIHYNKDLADSTQSLSDHLDDIIVSKFSFRDIKTTDLRLDVISDTTALGIPAQLRIVGSSLIVADMSLHPVLHILGLNNGSYVDNLGTEGLGPGEFQSITEVFTVSDTCIAVYDAMARRLTEYCQSNPTHKSPKPWSRANQTSFERFDHHLTDIAPLPDGRFIGVGYFNEGRLALLNHSFDEIKRVGPTPPGDQDTPVRIRQHAYQSFLAAHQPTKRVVIATRHADLLEIYSVNEGRTARTHGPEQFLPNYDWHLRGGSPSMIEGPKMRFGYIDVEVSGNRIYTVYSGDTRTDDPGAGHSGSDVIVFSLSGHPLHHFVLDRDVVNIAVPPSGSEIYATVLEPRPGVVHSDIPASSIP